MLHIDFLRNRCSDYKDEFIKTASGRYYTSELVGYRLARVLAKAFNNKHPNAKSARVIDPFGGDGRLVYWLISAWSDFGFPPLDWIVEIWDLDDIGYKHGQTKFQKISEKNASITAIFKKVDTFRETCCNEDQFDIVLTNPPWELLKPDRREITQLAQSLQRDYISKMREYDNWLTTNYPLSQPKRKFAGWGTNLSRVGFEVCLRLARENALVGVVLPASILADDQSVDLRKHLLIEHSIIDLAYYPAEAKQYEKADVPSITITAICKGQSLNSIPLYSHREGKVDERTTININIHNLKKVGYVLPVSFGGNAMELLNKLASNFIKWNELESGLLPCLWAGREIDETGRSKWLKAEDHNSPLFIKGRMVDRYRIREEPNQSVVRPEWTIPTSVSHERIVWRDVSRPSQKRRIIATIIPAGWVAGNSLGAAYFLDDNAIALKALLATMNSTTFEFQLRAYLATGHISLSALRKVTVPSIDVLQTDKYLAMLVTEIFEGNSKLELVADAYVAKSLYHLEESEYAAILNQYPKITSTEQALYLEAFSSLETQNI